jgi:carboxylesterase
LYIIKDRIILSLEQYIEVIFLTDFLHENAKEFFYAGSKTGILLIHGFTGSPSEMRYLGDYLKDKGYTVKGVLLKGHGTTFQDMRKTNYRDWIKSAEQGYLKLAAECDEVFVVGFSMGGALTLHLAQKYDIKGIVSLATPIKILNRQYLIATMAKYLKFAVSKQQKTVMKKDPFIIGYNKTPIKCMLSLLQLINIVKADLHNIEKPILIMQSYGDGTVHPSSANFIYKRIASTDKSIIFLHNSGHIITCDSEKEQVFEEVHSFISKRCSSYIDNHQETYIKTMEV